MKITAKPLLFLLASLLISGHCRLLPIVDDRGSNATEVRTYIVHVLRPEGAPELLSAEDREAWHHSFLPNATLDSGEPRLIYSYERAIGGFAARLTRDEVVAMESMDGFLLARPALRSRPSTTHSPDFLGLNQYSGLWYRTKFGQGAIIGVLDTGIVPTHPSFYDNGMLPPPRKWIGHCDFGASQCNNKIIGARAFLMGTHPSPLDDDGHGTHCAGVAAGNYVHDANTLGMAKGTAVGIAPRAHLAVYKVCCHNLNDDSDIIAGMDQAIKDGVDVLSLSLGHDPIQHMYEDEMAPAAFAAMTSGVLTSTSAGNTGPFPSSIKHEAPWFLTVGASSTDRRIQAIVRLGNGMEFEGESGYQPKNFTSPMLPMARGGNLTTLEPDLTTLESVACVNGTLDDIDVKGKIVLCTEAINSREEKGEVVKAAGGAAMILLNLKLQGSTLNAAAYTIPAAGVSYQDSLAILAYFNTTKDPTATIVFKGTQFGASPSPSVAYFSSRGPGSLNGGVLKPDIVGPGVNILGPWHKGVGSNPTKTLNNFYIASGTSMAAPHLAGIAAMIKKSHPQWSTAAIKSAIMTTAYTLDQDGNPITDDAYGIVNSKPANIFAVGAGHVNPNKADDPGLVYDIQPDDYIPYLCGLRFTDRQVSAMVNKRILCSKYQKISAEELNYPAIVVSPGNKSTKTVKRTVTNVGDATSVYTAKVHEPKGAKVVVSPEELRFSALHEQQTFTVEISTTGASPSKNDVLEGQLVWTSGKHSVRIPIGVTA